MLTRWRCFAEGVLVAKKDFNAPKHEELDVPNLEVIKAMQSLTSKGLVKTRFSWQWYYYVLTPEGVEFLREWCVACTVNYTYSHRHHFTLSSPRGTYNLGSTSRMRSCPRRTRRRFARHVPRRRAPAVAKVPTARPVAIGRTTARRRTRPEITARSLLALAVVHHGSDWVSFLSLSCFPVTAACGRAGTGQFLLLLL
jgi:hypothetical protein